MEEQTDKGYAGGAHLPRLGARRVSFFHFVSLPVSLVVSSLSRLQHCVSENAREF